MLWKLCELFGTDPMTDDHEKAIRRLRRDERKKASAKAAE